jgi:diacylglycerol kinase family enzyme
VNAKHSPLSFCGTLLVSFAFVMVNDARPPIPAFVNPRAGKADAACRALHAAGGFAVTEVDPASLADRVRDAAVQGARRILVAGGDGSVAAGANALAGSNAELAILPCGTLNHLAKDLSLPLDFAEAASLARDGSVVSIDAAAVNDRIFLSTSSVGAYVTFVRARERLERALGYHVASFIAAARLFAHLPLVRVTVRTDDVTRDYLTPLVFVGVGERELKLPALGARAQGGRAGLHVMIVRRRSGARTLALGLAAAARGLGAVAATPAMDAFLVRSIRIEPHTHVVSVDGELVRVAPVLEYRHLPGALRVVAPSGRTERA